MEEKKYSSDEFQIVAYVNLFEIPMKTSKPKGLFLLHIHMTVDLHFVLIMIDVKPVKM